MNVKKQPGQARAWMDTGVAAIVCVVLVSFTLGREWYQGSAERPAPAARGLVAPLAENDCNTDGIPDDVEIAAGASQDCNGNGIPDECDIADGTSDDCNDNWVPDECEFDTPHGLVGTYTGLFLGIEDNFEPLDNIEPFETVRGRIDPTVDFDWGGGGMAPWPGFDDDMFSIRWAGYVVTPNVSGEYAFYTRTDDGVRLWVDGQLIIDQWHPQAPTEHTGLITLQAGQTYRLVMEYFEDAVIAVAELRWEPPGQAKVIIPTEHLLPVLDCNENGEPDDCDIAGGYSQDTNGNGIPDECEGPNCPSEALFVASPPSGTIDARKPHPDDAAAPLYGIGMPDDPATAADEAAMTPIVIDLGVTGADAECFTLCETPPGSNAITGVTDHGDGTYTIALAHGIAAGAVTTVQYDGGSYAEYIHHPANVDGSSFANANDIVVVVNCLNAPGSCQNYEADTDASGMQTANDIIETVDLLNGAGAYAPGWYNTPLPENAGACP